MTVAIQGVVGGGETDVNHSTVSAKLDVDQTDRVRHYHQIRMSRDDRDDEVASNYSESSGISYDYHHTFDSHWSGRVSSGGSTNFSKNSPGDSNSRGNVYGNANLRYTKPFGEFLVNGNYRFGLAQGVWDDANGAKQLTANQSADIRYTRQDNPIYRDTASFQASLRHGASQSQSYSLRYGVASKLTVKDSLKGNANARMSRSDTGDTSGSISANGWWARRFNRSSQGQVRARYSLNMTEDRDWSQSSVDARYSDTLFGRRNLTFYGRIRWARRTEDDEPDSDQYGGTAGLIYSIGRFRATLDYNYTRADSGEGEETTDQRIMLEVRRSFTLRL